MLQPEVRQRRWLRPFYMWAGLAMLVVILGHQGAIAQSAAATTIPPKIQSPEIFQLICCLIGFFAGSLLVVESRRWGFFFLGLLVLAVVFIAIADLSAYFRYIQFSDAMLLLVSAAVGLALGLVVIGIWWWGHRQGYAYAFYTTLLHRNKHDQEFCDLVLNYEKAVQSLSCEDAVQTVSFPKALYYRASAARYRRLKQQPEINMLHAILVKNVLSDAQAEREMRLKRDKHQKLEALLEEVNAEYPLPAPASAPVSRRPSGR